MCSLRSGVNWEHLNLTHTTKRFIILVIVTIHWFSWFIHIVCCHTKKGRKRRRVNTSISWKANHTTQTSNRMTFRLSCDYHVFVIHTGVFEYILFFWWEVKGVATNAIDMGETHPFCIRTSIGDQGDIIKFIYSYKYNLFVYDCLIYRIRVLIGMMIRVLLQAWDNVIIMLKRLLAFILL